MNQQTGQDHYERDIHVNWGVYCTETRSNQNEKFESKWKAGEQYLKDDCMEYKITKITII